MAWWDRLPHTRKMPTAESIELWLLSIQEITGDVRGTAFLLTFLSYEQRFRGRALNRHADHCDYHDYGTGRDFSQRANCSPPKSCMADGETFSPRATVGPFT